MSDETTKCDEATDVRHALAVAMKVALEDIGKLSYSVHGWKPRVRLESHEKAIEGIQARIRRLEGDMKVLRALHGKPTSLYATSCCICGEHHA